MSSYHILNYQSLCLQAHMGAYLPIFRYSATLHMIVYKHESEKKRKTEF